MRSLTLHGQSPRMVVRAFGGARYPLWGFSPKSPLAIESRGKTLGKVSRGAKTPVTVVPRAPRRRLPLQDEIIDRDFAFCADTINPALPNLQG